MELDYRQLGLEYSEMLVSYRRSFAMVEKKYFRFMCALHHVRSIRDKILNGKKITKKSNSGIEFQSDNSIV